MNPFKEVTNEVALSRDKKVRHAWKAGFDPHGWGTSFFPPRGLKSVPLLAD